MNAHPATADRHADAVPGVFVLGAIAVAFPTSYFAGSSTGCKAAPSQQAV